jgi:hypothetical protein
MTRLLQVTVELEAGVEPIRGRIGDGRSSWEGFTGWLELIGALERARSGDPAQAEPGKDFGGIHDAGAAPRRRYSRSTGRGWMIDTRGDAMAYARIARFTGATPEQITSTVSVIEAAEGPPPGVPSTGVKVVVNEEEGTVIFIGFFESEQDLRAGDTALREMDAPPGGPLGTLASVDMGEIRVEREAS